MATASLPFIRRRSSASMTTGMMAEVEIDEQHETQPVGVVDTLNALTSYFLPEATAASLVVVDGATPDMTESLLTFHVAEEQIEEEEYNLPESILPMSPENSPRERSGSALSAASFGAAAATLTSWFAFEEDVSENEALEDEYVDEVDEDFLMDDEQFDFEEEDDELPTPAKLSVLAEQEDVQTNSPTSWTIKALGWPWVRAN